MANLFQPTFRASGISQPNIPGADVGALGDYVMKSRLANAEQQRIDLATKKAEQDFAAQEEERTRLASERDLLKNYNYDPRTDTSILDRGALSALSSDVKRESDALMRKYGLIDASGASTGKQITPEVQSELNRLKDRETQARKNIIMTKDDASHAIFADVLRRTGNPALAEKMSVHGASRFPSRADLLASEEKYVKNYNDRIDKIRSDLFKVKDLEIKASKSGKSTSSDTTYEQAHKTLSEINAGYRDEGVGQKFLEEAQRKGHPASEAIKFLLNKVKVSGFTNDKEFAFPDIPTAMVDFERELRKGNVSTDLSSFRTELANIGSYISPRSVSEIIADSGRRAFYGTDSGNYNRLGALRGSTSLPSSTTSNSANNFTPASNTTTSSGGARNILSGNRGKVEKGSNPIVAVDKDTSGINIPVDTLINKSSSGLNQRKIFNTKENESEGRLLDSIISFGKESREGSLNRKILEGSKEFFSGAKNEEVSNYNDTILRIARGEPVTKEEMQAVYSTASPDIRKLIDRRLTQLK